MQICEYDDKKGAASFDNYRNSLCRNSGEKLQWHLLQGESKFSNQLVVLTFQSSHWDPTKNVAHHGVKFQVSNFYRSLGICCTHPFNRSVSISLQFTISSRDFGQLLPVPAVRGVHVKMQFTELLEKPSARLGVGMLIFTNSTIQPDQRFSQTDIFDFGVELEAGNFFVSI